MRHLNLTAEDMADLIAGHTINAILDSGEEIIVAALDGVNKEWKSREDEEEEEEVEWDVEKDGPEPTPQPFVQHFGRDNY